MLESDRWRLMFKPISPELRWSAITQAAMWALLVILPAISGQHDPRLRHGMKGMHVQAFVAHRAVEALPIAVLPGAAGVDVQRPHLMLRQPPADRQRDELRPVVAPNELRCTMDRDQVLQDG